MCLTLYFRVEEYINQEFNGTGVKVEVIKGQSVFEEMYPCLAAVNRCASVSTYFQYLRSFEISCILKTEDYSLIVVN